MQIRKFLAVPGHSTLASVSLLAIRFVAGLAFMVHGWPKIQHPLSWMGPDGFAPAVFQALAAISEFGGGLAWILGLLTPLGSLGIAFTMAVSLFYHAVVRGDPFVSLTGGPAFELAALYFCLAWVLIATGPGRFSLDRIIFGAAETKRSTLDRDFKMGEAQQ